MTFLYISVSLAAIAASYRHTYNCAISSYVTSIWKKILLRMTMGGGKGFFTEAGWGHL